MSALNPAIFSWARESAGLTIERAAKKLGIKPASLEAYEAGAKPAKYSTICKMAKHYRRAVTTFYLRDKPRPADLGEDFRTRSDHPVSDEEAGLVRALLRNIAARQRIVKSAMEESASARRLPFIGSMRTADGAGKVAESIVSTLGFDLGRFRRQAGPGKAFDYARDLAQSCGVFVLLASNLGSHHTGLGAGVFRGFALSDSIAPFVAVNGKDAKPALPFTLFHELAHLWLGSSGLSGAPHADDPTAEKFCNDVASLILLPDRDLPASLINPLSLPDDIKRQVTGYAAGLQVSSTMLAYRLLRAGVLREPQYRDLANAYAQDFLDSRERRQGGSGPHPYAVKRSALGSLASFTESMLGSGHLSDREAGIVLGIHACKVGAFLSHGAGSRRT